jgi:hypothetical protein
MANIRLGRSKLRASSAKQRMVIAVNQAVKTGRRYTYLDLGRTQGIFKVVGGRATGRGFPKGARLRMMYDMSRKSVTVPANPWLLPSAMFAQKFMPMEYRKALKFQLKKFKTLN